DPVVDLFDAIEGRTLLFPEAGTNVAATYGEEGEGSPFEGCEVVVRQRVVNQRVAPCPMEVRSAVASFGEDGRLTFYNPTQLPFTVRADLAKLLGIDEDQIRVISPDVGGAFGSRLERYPEELLVAWLARRLSRPVRWVETRSESMLSLGHGRAQIQDLTIGGSRDGRVDAYRLEVVQDAGAYPVIGALLPSITRYMMTGTYDISKVGFFGRSVVTNTMSTTAYRGAGRPEATAAIERAMDLFASEIGMDPAEVRRANLVRVGQFPFTNPYGTVYDSGDYHRALDRVLEAGGYADLRREQAERRRSGDPVQLGLGLSTYVEITNMEDGTEFSSVEIRPDGRVVVKTGTSAHGQGHATAWSMLVAERLGISMEDVEFIQSDTDLVKSGGGTAGSRSLQTGGVATREAARQVLEMAKDLAAELLEASPEDIVVDPTGGGLHVAGVPTAGRSWAELSVAATEKGTTLAANVDFEHGGPTFPFGSHLAVVEVDTETGKVVLRRLVAVDDAGRILNPLLADGQVHGGLAQGTAQALLEEFRYDEEGNPLTSNFADYTFISAPELPSFERHWMETPTPKNELGAKGIGEAGTIGSTPAVQNAVIDALVHLGVRHIDMPTTPERVWRAVTAVGGR
ncbi:MAG TPA: molybdopterin cofactor-binding domain-containing protein, partial [Acidimicrobiales bacterium]|nr:molybdopterin cofactor-binding domain-containing protein [Acidimicrobiales bacterium]